MVSHYIIGEKMRKVDVIARLGQVPVYPPPPTLSKDRIRKIDAALMDIIQLYNNNSFEY